jgi:hypothetical protein
MKDDQQIENRFRQLIHTPVNTNKSENQVLERVIYALIFLVCISQMIIIFTKG